MLNEKKDFLLLEWYRTSGEEEHLGQNNEVGDEYFGYNVFVMREDNIVGEGGSSDNVVGEGGGNDDVVGKGGGSVSGDNIGGIGGDNVGFEFEYDCYDDFDNEALFREDNLDDDVESNGDNGDEGNNVCYTSEEAAYDDLGPILEDIGPFPEVEYEDSDQHNELSEEEEEEEKGECSSTRKRNRTTAAEGVLYNKEVHLRNPVLVPCMVFGNAGEFRDLIRAYAVQTNKSLKVIQNDKWRLRVHCKVEGCNFSVFCSRIGKTSNLSIKTMVEKYMCGETIRNRSVTVNFLASKYIKKIRRSPKISLKSFIGDVFDELHVEITTINAWRAIKDVGYMLFGSLKEGFRAGCRRLLCLDGCFFKGAFRGQILATIGEDRDNVSTPLLGKL
ncbi:hypothetical protein LIER_09023 [Lithospermum erythrorhizon]|uniref:Transposase MuDR plant domain-containing protein n=1 Tax=Lithospermum erythrorhizon TaxID=34254 RepID=A0AAV3PGC7_LITER